MEKKDNLCGHVHKLNATLKLRIDIDHIDSNSNFAVSISNFLRNKPFLFQQKSSES